MINPAPGTQVTLRFDGGAVGDAVAGSDGAAVVVWTIPIDASRGDHAVVFVGQSVYCEPASPVIVTGHDSATSPVIAEGTVGAAAGRGAAAPVSKPAGWHHGVSPATIAVIATAVAAAAAGAVQALRLARRRDP